MEPIWSPSWPATQYLKPLAVASSVRSLSDLMTRVILRCCGRASSSTVSC